ncbi:MAG: 30S ribosomal protein S6 [Parcubacteria group bacterium]|nr:30S ribosomal protein S6 [Parcubacteria group bacterium]
MQPYELCVLFAGSATHAQIEEHAKQVADLLAGAGADGKVTHVIGRKKLSYTTAGQTHGEYVVWLFEAETAAIKALNEKLRLASFVVRHAILKLENESIDERAKHLQETKAGKSVAQQEAAELREARTRGTRMRPVETHARTEHRKEEKKASLEELDRKLDEILESDKL